MDTNDIHALRRLAPRQIQPSVVMSFSHYYCAIAAALARSWALAGPPPDVVESAVHKDRFRAATAATRFSLRWVGVRTERQVRAAVDDLGLPLVVKPASGVSSTGVVLAHSIPEAIAAFRAVSSNRVNRMGQPQPATVVMEEYASGPEFSVEALTVEGRTSVYGVTTKLPYKAHPFIEQADTFPFTDPVVEPQLRAAAVAALGCLNGFSGPSHTEIRYTPTGPKIIEVNPRQGGGHLPTLIETVSGRNVFLDGLAERAGRIDTAWTMPGGTANAATWWQLYSHTTGAVRQFRYLRDTLPPQVRLLHRYVHQGDPVNVAGSNRDCIGAIVTVGTSAEKSLAFARNVSNDIRLDITSPGMSTGPEGVPCGPGATPDRPPGRVSSRRGVRRRGAWR
ncbi:ATP-grasp domain-containing protein [Embleya sp. NPDC001921]